LGINVKPIYSVYETYYSLELLLLGASVTDSTGLFSAGLVFRNIGLVINPYQYLSEDVNEPLPFDIQLGFSQKLAHAPFRFCGTFNQLHNWKLTDKSTWIKTMNKKVKCLKVNRMILLLSFKACNYRNGVCSK
jgi:hypothetical protein